MFLILILETNRNVIFHVSCFKHLFILGLSGALLIASSSSAMLQQRSSGELASPSVYLNVVSEMDLMLWYNICWYPSDEKYPIVIGSYFNQYGCKHKRVPKYIFMFQIYFLSFYSRNYCDCVFCSERCQNTDDLPSVLCLNASCLDTDSGGW